MKDKSDSFRSAVNFAAFHGEGHRLTSIVVDAKTGNLLDGVASPLLCIYASDGPVLASFHEGTWLFVDGSTRELAFYRRRGREVQLVRVVTYASTIGALVKFVCELADHADNALTSRNERAYQHQVEDYYGSGSPQTSAERNGELDADDRAALNELRSMLTVVS